MSITFHLAVLLVLTFFTIFVEPAAKGKQAAEDDPPEERKAATHLSGDSLTPGSPVVTNNRGIEGFGRNKNPYDFSPPGTEMADAGTAGGGKSSDFVDIGVPSPTGTAGGGSGDGTGLGAVGRNLAAGTGGGRGGDFFGTGLPRRGVMTVLYVVDCSGSMIQTFDYVTTELKRSISELQPRQQFHVIMFADGPIKELKIGGGPIHLVHATPENKRAACDWIDTISAQSDSGATLPADAFKRAFALSPRPELIFLLTDGLFPKEAEDLLRDLNRDKKVMINTIGFVDRIGESMLQRIARDHGGRYKFVRESDLGKDFGGGN